MAEEIPVAAWRCEECRQWRPAAEVVNDLMVLDVGPDIDTHDHLERAYVARRLRVCTNCRTEITGERLGFAKRPVL